MNKDTPQTLNSRFFTDLIRLDPSLLINGELEVIVKYNGSLGSLEESYDLSVEYLNSNYAIISGNSSNISNLYSFPQIEYIELPKTLTYELSNSRFSICATKTSQPPLSLTGEGTAIAIIDSGIDYTHPDFINDDGTSRIIAAWDQGFGNDPPLNFKNGTEYTNDQFNQALRSTAPLLSLPFTDTLGHGTAIAGIAAGNGRSSNNREAGIAPKASLIAVKLGKTGSGAFSRTTEVMRAVKYATEKAEEFGLPLSINLSYGTNNGPHDGNSLFEQYLNDVSGTWKTVITAATGNEGAAGHHYSNILKKGEADEINFSVSGFSQKIYMTLWSNFSDDFDFTLTSPENQTTPLLSPTVSLYSFSLGSSKVTVFMGQPTNYTQYREIYFLIEAENGVLTEGLWTLKVNAKNVIDGSFNIWLPTVEDVSSDTSFSTPDTSVTLTIPSTALRLISVGGYNANTNTAAAFSGRGYTVNNVYAKPDITAPAINILSAKSGGGYDTFTGTSLAAPFVSGSAALMMEWGIVRGNDPFLYGQRIKAFLQKGAKRTQNIAYPNSIWGYGTLCLSQTFELLKEYTNKGILL